MKILKYSILLLSLAFLQSCEIKDIPNPNGADVDLITINPTRSQLQTLVTGSEDLLRQEIGFYYDVVSIIGREYYFFTGSDPRYTGEVLGKGASTLDNAGFYGTRPYFGRYRTIKNLNILMQAVSNSVDLSDAEKEGFRGFAKTFQAYELHLVANLQFQNGIRIDVSDLDNLGGFETYDNALSMIQDLLDDASAHLDAAGANFAFNLSSAMGGFNNPAGMKQFNRGLSARIALYQGNKSDALSKLAGSFIDETGDLSTGPARFYSSAGGDFSNNIFRVADEPDGIIAHPSYVTDAEADDLRLEKVLLRPSGPLSLDELSGEYDVWVFQSLNDFVPYMNNEELVLIQAEANIGTDNDAAVAALNVIRMNAGLDDFTGTTDEEITAELIKQRRYSLFGLGHRWVDMRRWGLLGDLPIDREGDDVWEQFPRPVSEPQ